MSSLGEVIDINNDGGVLKTILTKGTGSLTPSNGNTVTVHYVGTLADNGDKFDSSRDRNDPFKFELGKGKVIKGWDVGVATMNIGEKSILTCRADYAYGEQGSPPKIPPGATLNFEVELIDWEGEDLSPDKDKTIVRSVIQPGEKYENPTEGSTVKVSAVGTYEGRIFFEKEVTFVLGEAVEVGLPEGIDRALRKFEKGEKSMLKLKGSRFTYGLDAPVEYNLPPNAEIVFTVFLREFENIKASWELTGDEKLEVAEATKERGNMFLKEGKYRLAISKYNRIEDLLQNENPLEDDKKEKKNSILVAGYLNSALIFLKTNEMSKCIEKCNKVLEIHSGNVKAMYRKAQALLTQNDVNEAMELFKKIVENEPTNKAAIQQIQVCKQKITEINELERKRCKKIFAKYLSSSKLSSTTNKVDEALLNDNNAEVETSA